jgi:hypothetical protein
MNADVPADHETTDETMSAALDAVRAAEWVLVQTPAIGLAEIRKRAQIALEMFQQGNAWPDGYLDGCSPFGSDRERGVRWEVILHRNLAEALSTIAA